MRDWNLKNKKTESLQISKQCWILKQLRFIERSQYFADFHGKRVPNFPQFFNLITNHKSLFIVFFTIWLIEKFWIHFSWKNPAYKTFFVSGSPRIYCQMEPRERNGEKWRTKISWPLSGLVQITWGNSNNEIPMMLSLPAKGQLISKCLFAVIVLTKIAMNIL